MNDRRIRVLFLPRWYPNRYDPMPGLFIRTLAEVLTRWCDVAVIYLHPDQQLSKTTDVVFAEENQVRVLRVYYPAKSGGTGILRKIREAVRYYRISKKTILSIKDFRPDIVHAHILTRTALIGWRFGRFFGAPLVISEHWSRYLPGKIPFTGMFHRFLTQWVAGQAGALIPVSRILHEAMKRHGIENSKPVIVPNIVDSSRLFPLPGKQLDPVRTVLHISCFDERSKNISGFLETVKAVYTRRSDFRVIMAGEGPDLDAMREYARYLGLQEPEVKFSGLIPATELSGLFQKADFTVVSSHYETFGTVIVESLACGVPVLSTSVGIAPEVIGPANGLLVPPGDPDSFTEAFVKMLDICRDFNPTEISGTLGNRFDTETVGMQVVKIYRDLLSDKK